jgi:hypothetical protein
MTALAPPRGRPPPRPPGAPAGRWGALSLATRFGLAALAVLGPATLAIGAFVAERIEDAVVRNAGQSTALFIDSVIAPRGPVLGETASCRRARRARSMRSSPTPALAARVVSFKFWDPEGRIVWADNDLLGRRFALTPPCAAPSRAR